MSQAMMVSGDNLAHFLYQADNEYLRLRESWPRPGSPEPELRGNDELQLRYDIFVSRIEVLRNALKGREAGGGPDVAQALRQAEEFIARADQVLGPGRPPPAPAAVQALREPLLAIDGALRSLTLEAARIVAVHSTRVTEVAGTHNRLGIGLSMLLVVMAVAFATYAWQQLQRLHRRRAQLETLTAELREARVAAEASSASKSSFLANMSHEIRTPFQGLKGMLGLLGNTPLDEQQTTYLRTASSSADHLLMLLNDILDMSRLESGRMTLAPTPVVMRDLLSEVEALMQPQAQLKGLDYRFEIDLTVPQRALVDATRMRQILFNLLANAIKFTERGQVTLAVKVPQRSAATSAKPLTSAPDAEVAGLAVWEFTVTDTGIGMDERTVARLFQRFSQGDDSRSRRFGGTGLGLEISRNLARLMGGDIVVASRSGQGSTFTFTAALPVLADLQPAVPGTQESGESHDAQPTRGRSLRVLVADDNEVNRMVMEAILAGLGHAVGFAENGEQALSLATQQDWDMVLMDLHMPVMDGLEATRAIRSLGASRRADVPIVALTADVFPETRERCVAAGVQGFLTKPVDTAELAACLQRLVPVPS